MTTPAERNRTSTRATDMKRYQCYFCGFIYDEAQGLPDKGIAPGTRWENVPDSWTCPTCGAGKSDFAMMEVDG